MNLYTDYLEFTAKTAIYPQHVAAEYLTLGLCSEAAECVELHLAPSRTSRFTDDLGGEMGDVQWYVARLCYTYNMSFAAVVANAKEAYRPFPNNIDTLLTKITVEAGLVAGKVKKQVRDGAKWTGEEREDARQYIRGRLVRIVELSMYVTDWLYTNHNSEYNSYDKLLKMNRIKLQSRLERDAIGGDGSNR